MVDLPSVVLRCATAADVEVCLGVQRAAAVIGYAHIFDQTTHPFPDDVVRAEWVQRFASNAVVLIASIEEKAGGVIGVRDDRVEGLFVVPEQWGRGLGQRLHAEAITRITDAGHDSAVLNVLVANTRARRFYEKQGWTVDGEATPSRWPPYPEEISYRLDLHAA